MVFIITLLYILVALLIFGLLIFIHEFGHFICARIFGVGVKEFAIGFGPEHGKICDLMYCQNTMLI